MSKSLLQTRILDKLEVIMTQVDTMNKFGKNIPIIHLDILKSNIRVLYEQICELERVQMHTEVGQNAARFSAAAALDKSPRPLVEVGEKAIVTQATKVIADAVEAIQQEMEEEFVNSEPISLSMTDTEPVALPIEAVEPVALSMTEAEPVALSMADPEPLALTEESVTIEMEMYQPASLEQKAEMEIDFEEANPKAVPEASPVIAESKEMPLFEMESPTLHFSFDDEQSQREASSEQPVMSPIPDIFASLQTISERYNNPESTLNEVISVAQVATVNTHVKTIRDLKAAIGVNEKFLFINDLFMGNMKEYTDTILALNEAESLGDVQPILTPLRSKYKWTEEGIAYQTLMDFIRRRFA